MSRDVRDRLGEAGARALFEHLFKACERLDGNNLWPQADERIKAGFRKEAGVVLDALLATAASCGLTITSKEDGE